MPSTRDMIYALAKRKRNPKNLEEIQEMLEMLREHADNAEQALSALAQVRESAGEFRDNLDDENLFLPSGSEIDEKLQEFLDLLPGDDEEDVGDLIATAEGYAEEYENCLDDRDYTRENRNEVWDNLCNALTDIADAMS